MSSRDQLHSAVEQHDVRQAATILANGEGVDVLDRMGRSALFYAVNEGDVEIVDLLLKNQADPNRRDKAGEGPLHFAARSFQIATAERLIRAGAVVDLKDSYGNTPLHRAVFDSRGRGEMIALLLECGADRNSANNSDVTPLSLAKSAGNYNLQDFFR